jgi:hypothetical protein
MEAGKGMENETTPAKVWTREEITTMLNTSDRAVERAMVALWERQEEDERTDGNTRHRNGCGFAHSTVGSGTYFANWVRSGRRLTGHHLAKARRIAHFHAGQLTAMANAKSAQESK